MVDPLTITGGIAAILQIASTVIHYLTDTQHASEDRRKLINEIGCVSGFLFVLKELTERAQCTDSWYTSIRHLGVPNGPLEQFKEILKSLERKLQEAGGVKVGRTLAWPLQKREIGDLLQKIERNKALFVLALQNDHFELSLAIRKDIASLQDGVQSIHDRVSQLQLDQQKRLQDQERSDLLAWLSPLNFWSKQNDVFARRQEGTGKWLLEADEFKQWLIGIKRTLFCPGIPGAGKTVLASTIINYLEWAFQNENVGIAYLYCAYRDQNQTAVNLVASLLKQLIQQQPAISDNILRLYRHHRDRDTHPSLSEYSRLLQLEIGNFSKTFVVVDALDECSEEMGVRMHLLTEVRKLLPMIRLLVTSRPVSNIETEFKDTARLEIRASDGDVKQYLESCIESQLPLAKYVKKDPDLQDAILNIIVEKAGGMFLLAQLHMDSLARKDNRKGVKRALQSLPEKLDRTYEEAMNRIQKQDLWKAKRANQVLSWLSYAVRPITVDEIQSALAVEDGDTDLDEEALPDKDILVSVCAGLVTIDQKSNIIRLVHHTTQNYFERTRVRYFQNAQAEIAQTCLTYLSFDAFADGFCRSDDEMEIRLQKYHLLQYASQHWGAHAREVPGQDQRIKILAMKFLDQEPKISCCIQAAHIPKDRYKGYSQHFPRNVTGLQLAATLGLEEITASVLLEKRADVQKRDSDGGTALHWAAWNGHATVMRLLLNNGADVNATYSSGGTPLHWAAEGGRESLVQLLLENKADITAIDKHKLTPLHRAAWNGHDAVVQLLLENGADITAGDCDGGTVLHGAAENGHEMVVRLLLEKGIDVNSRDFDGGTALHRAAWNGHEVVVRLLLERGADVAARYCFGGMRGQEVVVRLLLEKGVGVAAKYFCGGTPLHWAAWSGHDAVVRLLLDNNADFTAEDSDGETALHGAVANGHEAVVQLFLGKGRDDAMKHSDENITLDRETKNGYEMMMRQLLEKGPDITTKKETVSTALHWAAWSGREGAVRPLLEGGADVNAVNTNGRTPLHWAAWSGQEAIVQLLLEKGADITAKDNGQWTALHWAAWNGHDKVVQLLLEKGSDITAKDSDGKTALDWAAAGKHEVVVNLLTPLQIPSGQEGAAGNPSNIQQMGSPC